MPPAARTAPARSSKKKILPNPLFFFPASGSGSLSASGFLFSILQFSDCAQSKEDFQPIFIFKIINILRICQ
jgi:hypothetical protein